MQQSEVDLCNIHHENAQEEVIVSTVERIMKVSIEISQKSKTCNFLITSRTSDLMAKSAYYTIKN